MLKPRAKRNVVSRIHDFLRVKPARRVPDMLTEICAGLLTPPRSIPPKYFYDDKGSLLFDRICNTEEYYLTRTEAALLSSHGTDIIAATMPNQILELGSGVSHKIRLLFDACEELSHTCEYAPFDYCEPMVNIATGRLISDYDWLAIKPMIGDYHAGLCNLPPAEGTRLMAFLGSTIGNFTPDECRSFIQDIRLCLHPGDFFLIGADRVKEPSVLNAAYNDAEGVTAEFNLNILRVINRELDANFDVNNFYHSAFYNELHGQIEMYLISTRDQEIMLGKTGAVLNLEDGEAILTEISRKFTAEYLEFMIAGNGFRVLHHYTPDNQYFSLLLAEVI